ncbi:MaoC family dehydratase [Amycolatopsis rhizosphaerae]|uniref:MaoC family dehydratase n=1 Tax=Amycolatopsis rhizosphaerae TaxID=2053003 RepID=A0A558DJX1_9PSEU|nr:MaoC family dehydratase [Amycolatopsis rhizosphaerae]TVT61316.1 MaoC family dehydratase [Amycolatopsis rhizosphaerae]
MPAEAETAQEDRLVVRGLAGLRAAVGTMLGPTAWLSIDQQRIDAFADVTGDHQWIHVDPGRARESPFGSTIAHGYLTLSLCNYFLPQLLSVEGVSMGLNYGANRVRFPAPVPTGARIRGRGEILTCEDIPGGVQATIRIVAEVEGGTKPGCVVETLNRWLV